MCQERQTSLTLRLLLFMGINFNGKTVDLASINLVGTLPMFDIFIRKISNDLSKKWAIR